MELLKKVKETISKYSMLSEGDCVLIGLSGGPDSVCLAAILDKLKKDFNLSLSAVYVDHGLRPDEVEAEKAFCREFCDGFGINFFCESVDVKGHASDTGLSKQEAARELRYKIFDEISGKISATKIALGHNADDQAETLLMMVLRGAGRKGLAGIPPVRDIALSVQRSALGVKKNVLIIRPLIEIERKDIEEFFNSGPSPVTRHPSLPFMIDSSNLRKDYFRNWIRLTVMPELRKRNPSLVQNICRTMDILREEDNYLEIIVTKTLMKLITNKTADTIELFLVPLETMEKPILRRVLRRAIDATEGLREIGFVHIEDIINLVKKGASGDRIYLPQGIRVIKSYATLKLTSAPPVKINSHSLDVPGELALKEAGVVIKSSLTGSVEGYGDGKSDIVFDADKINLPLTVRHRKEGDCFYPAGFGKRKKLQDFFVDEKIPRDKRDAVPVVVSGDDVVWIAGYRADGRFTATDRTEKFLRLIISRMK
ncbi:MAG: tRNA lysidine(34) synthetase TilS [Nitrospirae bacterium]|nr:tRNA lysidine(34) synthetase TilS [Nitrospirota bacterium]